MARRLRNTINKRPSRKIRKVIVLGLEGKNKTEKLYFTELVKRQQEYNIMFCINHDTDPIQLINNVNKFAKKQDIKLRNGDIKGVVFDVDLDQSKVEKCDQISKLALETNVNVYSSNPCFELWFIYHFEFSTKSYNSSEEVVKALKKYIPEYEKNRDDYGAIIGHEEKAIINSKKVQEYMTKNCKNPIMSLNPNTDVYKLVYLLINIDNYK